jgi:type IV secretory pathway VirB2 component (pilin)
VNKKILFLTLLLAVLIVPVCAYADLTCGDTTGGNEQLSTILTNFTNAASAVGSALAIIGFIIAGIMWLTASGAPEKISTAKKALMAAVIGTAILALAQGANIMTDIFCKIISG